MAISDLALVAAFLIPEVYLFISNTPFHLTGLSGRIFCTLRPFIRDSSLSVSILSMIAIALERFVAVVFPLKAQPRWMEAKIVIPLTWMISIASFIIYFYLNKLKRSTCYRDFDHSSFSLFVVITFFIVPLIFLTITYSTIIWKLKHHHVPGNQSTGSETARRKRNKNVTKLGIFIVVSFFVSWFPYHLFSMITTISRKQSLHLYIGKSYYVGYLVTVLISYISIATNPVVCLVCSSKFRECFVKMFIAVNAVSATNTDLVDLRPRQNAMITAW